MKYVKIKLDVFKRIIKQSREKSKYIKELEASNRAYAKQVEIYNRA